MQNPNYVGVDVSRAMLDVALPSLGPSPWRTPNTPAGAAALARKLGRIECPHVVCDYARLLAKAMDAEGITFSAVNPR
ncbi:MAG: hypothetical protein ACK5NN_08165 [Sphingomonadaceae bacterium]